jgi:hypothetical protein
MRTTTGRARHVDCRIAVSGHSEYQHAHVYKRRTVIGAFALCERNVIANSTGSGGHDSDSLRGRSTKLMVLLGAR